MPPFKYEVTVKLQGSAKAPKAISEGAAGTLVPDKSGSGAPPNLSPALIKHIFIHTNQKIVHKIS